MNNGRKQPTRTSIHCVEPDAANYNNLGNDMAKLGKSDEARAAYQSMLTSSPTDAGRLAQLRDRPVPGERMKEAMSRSEGPALDQKSAQAGILLGVAWQHDGNSNRGDNIPPLCSRDAGSVSESDRLDPMAHRARQAGARPTPGDGLGITRKSGSSDHQRKAENQLILLHASSATAAARDAKTVSSPVPDFYRGGLRALTQAVRFHPAG